MNNQSFQNFGATPAQTQVYPDGTIRVIQNNNQMIATTAIQQSQERHPHQHPQIIQNMPNKLQSQAVYYTQGQGQQAVIMKTSMGNNAVSTPPMSYNSIYSVQGQTQTQSLPLYSTASMNIQIANTPPNTAVNTLSNSNNNNAVMMTQQNGVLNEISSTYAVAQPIQTQETKNYSNQIFVLPSPTTPTPQITYTTSSNSHSNIVQVQQQTPPQNISQQSSQYVIKQKSGQAIGISSNQQVILQTPPTPYCTSPTTTQVQVLTQGGKTSEVMNVGSNYTNTSMVSPPQVHYTSPVINDKDNKVATEISNGEKVEGQENTTSSDSQTVFSSHLFNKISISSPTSTSMYTVDTSIPVDMNGQNKEKDNVTIKKDSLFSTVKDEQDHKNTIQDSGLTQVVKEEVSNPIDKTNNNNNNDMSIDNPENKIKMETVNNMNNVNGITVMTTMANPAIATTLDSTLNQSIATSQNLANNANGIIQGSQVNNNSQNINMISNINTIQGVNVINGMNNVNYIQTNMNQPNVNINGINTIQGVQMATAYPANINTMNTMNVVNGQNGNIINISPNQTNVPLNANNSINLYYNQNVVNGSNTTTTMNYTNANMMDTTMANNNKSGNGYKARTKNSHIVDPDVPIEVLIKRRKNTEAARRSRLRKAERIQVLTEIVHNLEEKNKELTIKIAELQEEQANWIKKESEYVSQVKQLKEKLNESNPESVNDENDKNSFNIAASNTTSITDTTSATEKQTIKKDVENNA